MAFDEEQSHRRLDLEPELLTGSRSALLPEPDVQLYQSRLPSNVTLASSFLVALMLFLLLRRVARWPFVSPKSAEAAEAWLKTEAGESGRLRLA